MGQYRQIKITIIITLVTLLSSCESNAQVAFSETFQNTVKRIAKEQTKKAVIEWVTKEDPAVGILAQDLIGQVIDSRDEEQLITSNISVITTMLFIYRVQVSVEKLFDDSTADTVIKQAMAIGWSKKDLVVYSSLYFYYSERLKRNLFVSPYILNMWDVRSKIESLKYKEGKSWVAYVSSQLTKSSYHDLDITLDVRAVEILRIALLRQFSQDSLIDVTDDFVDGMCRDYISNKASTPELVRIWDSAKSIDQLRPYLFRLFLNQLENAVKQVSIDIESSELPFNLQTLRQLVLPFCSYADSALVWKSVPRYSREEIVSNLKLVLNDWLADAGKNCWSANYKVMLAGTFLSTDEKVDFTVFDHLRWGYTGKEWMIYGFAGGFIDPLIKHTINKEGSRVYLIGVGLGFRNLNLMPAIGIPYDNIMEGKYQLCFTFGYEIPLSELTD